MQQNKRDEDKDDNNGQAVKAHEYKKKQIEAPPLSKLENVALSISLSLYVFACDQ